MDNGTIISIIIGTMTFVITVASLVFMVKNSKGYINKQIDKKELEIRAIEQYENRKYGLNGHFPNVITKEYEKKEKLRNQINELRRNL